MVQMDLTSTWNKDKAGLFASFIELLPKNKRMLPAPEQKDRSHSYVFECPMTCTVFGVQHLVKLLNV